MDKKERRGNIIAAAGVLAAVFAVLVGVGIEQFTERFILADFLEERRDGPVAVVFTPPAEEIDWEDAEVYLDFADRYIREGDFETALKYAEEGYKVTGNKRLREKADMIRSGGNIYDSFGRRVRVTGYDSEGNISWQHKFSYNLEVMDYNPVSVTAYDEHGTEIGRIELKYDKRRFRDIDSYYIIDTGTGEIGLIKYSYPDAYTKKAEWYRDPEGKELDYYYITEYDENGRLIRDEWYDADDVLYEYGVAVYDENGNVVRKNWYECDINGEEYTLFSYTVKEYDTDGRLVKEEEYYSDGQLRGYYISEYDTDGRMIKYSSYDKNGVLKWYDAYKNDEDIKGLGIEHYDKDGNLIYEE